MAARSSRDSRALIRNLRKVPAVLQSLYFAQQDAWRFQAGALAPVVLQALRVEPGTADITGTLIWLGLRRAQTA